MDEKDSRPSPEDFWNEEAEFSGKDFSFSGEILDKLPQDVTQSGSFNLKDFKEVFLSRFLQTIPLDALLVDHTHAIVFTNNCLGRKIGDTHELVGKSFSSLFVHPSQADKARSLLEKSLTMRKSWIIDAVVRISGKQSFQKMHFRPVRLERRRLVMILMQDITAQKVHGLLNKKYRELVQVFPVGIAEFVLEKPVRVKSGIPELLAAVENARLCGGNREFAKMQGHTGIHKIRDVAFKNLFSAGGGRRDAVRLWASQGFSVRCFESQETGPNAETRYTENTLAGQVSDGISYGFWVMQRDVSAQKLEEEALRASEERFRKIFEEGPIGISIIRNDNTLEKVNRAYCRMLEYSQMELAGKTVRDLTHVDDRQAEAKLMTRMEHHEIASYTLQKRLRRKTGEFIIANVTAFLIHDDKGHPLHAIELVLDVTESLRSEYRVKLLSAAFEQSSEGVAVTDMSGHLIFVNQAFAEMHGYGSEQLLGKHISFFHDPGDMQNRAKKRLETEFNGEVSHLRADGTIFPGFVHCSVLRDDSSRPMAIVNALRDITELKKTEEALRATNEKLAGYTQSLENKVRERTQHLEDSRKEIELYAKKLEQANDALKVLISGIEEQKKSVEKKISENIQLAAKPILDQLKGEHLPDRIRSLVETLDSNLDDIASALGPSTITYGHLLTLREIRICEMIKSGLSSKEIAQAMGVSPQTIFFHRSNIRRKLGFTGSVDDLATCLKSMS